MPPQPSKAEPVILFSDWARCSHKLLCCSRMEGGKANLHLHEYFMNFGHLHDELRPLKLRLLYEHGKLLVVLLSGLCDAQVVSYMGAKVRLQCCCGSAEVELQATSDALRVSAHKNRPSTLFQCSSLITWGRMARYMMDMSISPTVTMALHRRHPQLQSRAQQGAQCSGARG